MTFSKNKSPTKPPNKKRLQTPVGSAPWNYKRKSWRFGGPENREDTAKREGCVGRIEEKGNYRGGGEKTLSAIFGVE